MASDIEAATTYKLKNASGVTDLLASTDSVYFGASPVDAEYPFIVLSVVDRERVTHMGGSIPLRNASIQVFCYAQSYEDARGIGEAVETEIGDSIDATYANLQAFQTSVKLAVKVGDADITVAAEGGSGVALHARQITYKIWYTT